MYAINIHGCTFYGFHRWTIKFVIQNNSVYELVKAEVQAAVL